MIRIVSHAVRNLLIFTMIVAAREQPLAVGGKGQGGDPQPRTRNRRAA